MEPDQEMPQSTLSDRSPKVVLTRKKMTPKRSRELTPPIKLESEENESPKNTDEEGSQLELDEESREEEDSEPEPEPPRKKDKGQIQTLSKGKVTRVTKASASRK